MAGNFSFGDYFKERRDPARVGAADLPRTTAASASTPSGCGPTVYLDDDEAYQLWTDVVGVPAERIQRRGKEDNYWSMGVPGPCGPCTEIYFDRGPEYGTRRRPERRRGALPRGLEPRLHAVRPRRGRGLRLLDHLLGDLPARNIDTGMGVERMAMILQGVDNVYEIDMLRPVLDRAAELSGVAVRRRPRVRRPAAGGRRPHAHRDDADRRRRRARQRGPRLRAAPDAAPRGPHACGCSASSEPAMGELVALACEVMSPSYPGAGRAARRGSRRSPRRRRSRSSRPCGPDRRSSTASRRPRRERQSTVPGDAGLPPARHLRLPDRPDPRDGRASRACTSTRTGFRRLMDEQRQRAKRDTAERKSAQRRRRRSTAALLEHGGQTDLHRVLGGRGRGDRPRRWSSTASVHAPRPRATRSRSSSTSRRSTPSPVASSPTTAGSARATARSSRCYDVAAPGRRSDRAPRPGRRTARSASATRCSPRSTSSGARRSRARTPRPISCTRRSGGRSASPRPRPGRRTTPAGSASTSPRRPRCRDSVLADVEAEVNEVLLADLAVRAFVTTQDEARTDRRDGAVRREVRRRTCGWSRSATTPASCAAARMRLRSAQLGVVKLLERGVDRRRQAPGRRRWSAPTRSATSPASTCWSAAALRPS